VKLGLRKRPAFAGAGKHARNDVRDTVRADINVTPLVDVVLVLLIIFMVVAPMISANTPVELPRTEHHQRKPDDGKDLMVSVTRAGQVYFAGKAVEVREVPALVTGERRRTPTRPVFLLGDAASRYGDVRAVMEAIHKGAGVDELQLRTDEAPRGGEPDGHERR
jgi:biopolymer transport protein ExbD